LTKLSFVGNCLSKFILLINICWYLIYFLPILKIKVIYCLNHELRLYFYIILSDTSISMIEEYAKKLIENFPDNHPRDMSRIDLIMDGGIFNGSYLLGSLYFLKEMEKKKYLQVERISGCSIGAIAAIVYLLNSLDLMYEFYELVLSHLKEKHNLSIIHDLKRILAPRIPDNICPLVNHKLYISFYNVKKGKKIVKSTYKDVDDLFDTIYKSSFFPLLIDGNLLYKKKYMDGFNPFIFKSQPNKKILYLDLFGYDKVGYMLTIKNEKNNFHRILNGLLDIHGFFIKQSNTSMCSFKEDWTLFHKVHHFNKQVMEKSFVITIYMINTLCYTLPREIHHHVLIKIIKKIMYDIYVLVLENYCL